MGSIWLFNFNPKSNIGNWQVVNDSVMGGLSKGEFCLSPEGHGLFQGKVSLKNNGGFSSVRYRFDTIQVQSFKTVAIRLRGDGKNYRFRIKSNVHERHSYVSPISTDSTWQTITLKFSKMYPAFRGRVLDMPNYPGETLAEIAFLIGNKKEEDFSLEIDFIELL